MNPNKNFVPPQMIKKPTSESENDPPGSSLMQPPILQSSKIVKSNFDKTDDPNNQTSTNEHPNEGNLKDFEINNDNKAENMKNHEQNDIKIINGNPLDTLKIEFPPLKRKDSNENKYIISSQQKSPHMKSSILKNANLKDGSPKKSNGLFSGDSPSRKPGRISFVPDPPQVKIFARYQEPKKGCSCACQIF